MFDFIEGEIVSKTPGQAVLLAGGFGVSLSIPLSTFDRLPQKGRVRLLAHLHLREDGLQLFGFFTREERELFLLLNTVKGVGPRLALKILSGVDAAGFARAVAETDTARLCRVPGVGRKTAERLVLELKDSVALLSTTGTPAPADAAAADAVVALITLGAGRTEAEKAVDRVRASMPAGSSADEIVRECLRSGLA